jgi:hypothetical protein
MISEYQYDCAIDVTKAIKDAYVCMEYVIIQANSREEANE